MTTAPFTEPTPVPTESSSAWEAKTHRGQDRWTLTLPGNTLSDRYVNEYRSEHGALPGRGWLCPPPPPYVKVTATLASGKFRHSVLKTEVAGGSERTYATLAPEAFGEDIASIRFTAGTQRQFRLAQLNTPANRLKLIAVVLGAISAAVSATLPMTTGTAQLALRWLAAFLAVAAPVLAWTGSSWFS